MTIHVRLMTAEDLLELPDDSMRHELIEGELRTMPPAGHEHGSIAMTFGAALTTYVQAQKLGRVYAAETGFTVSTNPDTVLAPDVAFVSTERLSLISRREGYFPGVPDLAVEVISPNDRYSEVEEKVRLYLGRSTPMVVIVDPRTETLKVYRSPNEVQILTKEDTLEGGEVVPGWTLSLSDLFANL